MGDLHRLVAFDLDGTLVDSRRDLADAANDLVTALGGAPLSEAAIGTMVGEGAARLVSRVLAAAGLPESPDALPRFLAFYDDRLLDHTRPYDGMAEAVRIARAHARVVLLTNKPKPASERILAGLSLRELFDDVVGGDGPWPRKPDPSALQALMADAGATPGTTLMVGDSAVDRLTASRAGARCCLVSFGFGFRQDLRDESPGADWIVDDAAGLTDVIARFAARAAAPPA